MTGVGSCLVVPLDCGGCVLLLRVVVCVVLGIVGVSVVRARPMCLFSDGSTARSRPGDPSDQEGGRGGANVDLESDSDQESRRGPGRYQSPHPGPRSAPPLQGPPPSQRPVPSQLQVCDTMGAPWDT